MGWANCGEDSDGRPIGYGHEATCDQEGCEAQIDRGLAYACGGMHGEGTHSCERYFCESHLSYAWLPTEVVTENRDSIDELEINAGLCARCLTTTQQINRVYESEERFEISGHGTMFVVTIEIEEAEPKSPELIWMNGRRVTCTGFEYRGFEWRKRPIGLLVRAYDEADVDETY